MSLTKLITPKAFVELLQKETSRRVVPVDSTWYLPNVNRSGKQEFLNQERIPHAVFFDIDSVKDANSPYPHMVPNLATFNKSMSDLGLQRSDVLVVYDRIGNFSAPRCAWTLSLFGHPSVYLLNNYNLYKRAGCPLDTIKRTAYSEFPQTDYKSDVDLIKEKVVSYEDMLQLVQHGELAQHFNVYDARSLGRFDGSVPEPRPGLSSGHVMGVQPLPFEELLEPESDAFPQSPEDMKRKLNEVMAKLKISYNPQLPTIVMCGTGVSACIILTALELAGIRDVKLYDGSWTEWVMRSDPSLVIKGRE
ncbi:TUM1 (YOR251C) [Zygosaccharomyces parabailii]|nr:TUM1 (YOR251C) [Zygosaccharomyces parabailii]CDH08794.1 related to thiosulfate sulfurtransferases [Zygosaccharomyces bailii ISA1307]